jgi:hypothetical protein
MKMDNILDITQKLVQEFSEIVAEKYLILDEKEQDAVMQAVVAATAYLHITSMQALGVNPEIIKLMFSSSVDSLFELEGKQ